MKKNPHELRTGGKSKYNAQLFGNNTRVVATHPLKVRNEDLAAPAYAANAEKKMSFQASLSKRKIRLNA